MQPKSTLSTLLALIIVILLSPAAHAQGLIVDPRQIPDWHPHPMPIPRPWPAQPVTIERQTYEIKLDNQFAHIKLTQIFRNNTPVDLEAIYVFPLPPDADISDFAMWMDGKKLTAETLDANQARSIYQQIVSSMRDPGLLEYMDGGMIRASIYPVPRNGTKEVAIEFDWLLQIQDGLIKMTLPLKLDGFSIDKVENLAISVDINSPDALGTIFSPTHDIDVDRKGANRAIVGLEKSSHRPTGNFVLYIGRPDGAVGLNLLTHTTGNNEGYFLAMVAPEYNERRVTVIPKDFALVLDTSGSMAGQKIEQAKEALKYIFRNLNKEDRFCLITFATDARSYFDGWRDSSPDNIKDVIEYISGIDAGGSTNIQRAFEMVFDDDYKTDRPMYVIFISDGLPTVGETNTALIIKQINSWNSSINARIFSFGVGDDVDYAFIDRLSKENGGYTANVAPNEDLEQPLSDFYSKIKSPVVTDIDIDISGVRIYDMLPDKLPDLFLGSQLIIAGRYQGSGRGNVRLTGKVGNDKVTYNYPVEFSDSQKNDFIPRNWATRRVGYLLNQIRLYGQNQEVVDEIVKLATRYGIITPYTSMLIVEDETRPPISPPVPMPRNGWVGGGGFAAPSAPGAERKMSREMQSMEQADTDAVMLDEQVKDKVKYAGDKTFYLNDEGYFEDSEFAASKLKPIEIVYGSEEYFKLLAAEPDLADYLSVAEKVIVVWKNKAYKILPGTGEPVSISSEDKSRETKIADKKNAGVSTGCGTVSTSGPGSGLGSGLSSILPSALFLFVLYLMCLHRGFSRLAVHKT